MKIYFIFVLLLFDILKLSGTEQIKTDEEMLYDCLKQTGEKIAVEILKQQIDSIYIETSSISKDDNSNFILMEGIANGLKNETGRLFIMNKEKESSIPILAYTILFQKITVEEKKRLLSESFIKRKAQVRVAFRVFSPSTGEILIAKEIENSIGDEISKKAYTNLNKKNIESGTFFLNLVEPVVVTAIVAGLMYLFYSKKNSK